MISQGIVIEWSESKEYIELDFRALQQTGADIKISKTYECWNDGTSARYSTSSTCTRDNAGKIVIEVEYRKEENGHLSEDMMPVLNWGQSTIIIENGQNTGYASWSDKDDKKNDGETRWERIDQGLIGNVVRRRTTQIQREQQKFRAILIADGGQCVLTGEETHSALEAAHIIPKSQGGKEVIGNGILLRADLHRLYDSGAFHFDANGAVAIAPGGGALSDRYRQLLGGKRLDDKTLTRVRSAIDHRLKQ